MAQVENLKIGNTSYGITDANTLPALNATTRAQLLLDGTYLGSAVENGKVFESDAGKFEQFSKTPGTPTFTWSSAHITGLNSVALVKGNDKYAIAGIYQSNVIKFSTDLITWTSKTLPSSQAWGVIGYGNGTWVALSNNAGGSTVGVYSKDDGNTWTQVELPKNSYWTSIAYGNGVFVASGREFTGSLMYSPDGITWSLADYSPYQGANKVIFDGTQFVVASRYHSQIFTSTNGANWTGKGYVRDSGSAVYDIDFNGTTYYALSGAVYSSPDCVTWSKVADVNSNMTALVCNKETKEIMLLKGYQRNSSSKYDKGAYSPDGETFTEITLPVREYWFSCIADGNGFVVEPYNATIYKTSVQTPYTYSLTELNPSLKNTATDTTSLTVGGTATTATRSTNVGASSSAGSYSASLGCSATANGTGAVSVGYAATANPTNAIAIGAASQATARGAIALGANARNSETKTFKVALTDSNAPATDEASGLYTLLKSNGKMPVDRLENVNVMSTGNLPGITTVANYRSQLLLNNAVGSKNDLWYCNTITQDSINGTVTGKLLRNGAYVCGFSKTSYINTNITLASTDTYELLLKLRTDEFAAGSANQTFLSDASTAYMFMFYSSKKMAGYNGTTFSGTYVYDNNWHWVKIKWDGTALTVSYLKDASQTYQIDTLPTEGWTTDITAATNIFSGKTLCLGNRPNGAQPYAGSFDLNGCRFIKNGSVVWTGTVNNGATEYYWRSPLYSTNYPGSVQIGGLVQGSACVVIGDKARTTSDNSVVIGNSAWSGTTDSSTNNVVVGCGARALAGYSVAIGQNAAGSSGAVSVGYAATANQMGAIAIGVATTATAKGAIALGANARNSETKTFKVALTDTNAAATDESTGLFTLLKADGKIPAGRLGTLPTADGTYTLTLTVTGGVPVLSFTAV